MRETLTRIIALQLEYSATNTPSMRERGLLVRNVLPSELRELFLNSSLDVEGRDGTGQRSKVPWVRIFDPERSPSAREGWYVLYLFHEDGRGATLSLNQAATKFIGGNFEPLPRELLEQRVEWARARLAPWAIQRHDFSPDISIGHGTLALAYERGHVLGRTYTTLPSEAVIRNDLLNLVELLNHLYQIEPTAPPPGAGEPVVASLKADIAAAAGKASPIGAPRRLSPGERSAIEAHSMSLARRYLEERGYGVEDTHATESYDYVARRGNETIYVEVKGTTTTGQSIILTRNEVAHHQANYPNSCLILVSGILMLTASHGTDLHRRYGPGMAFLEDRRQPPIDLGVRVFRTVRRSVGCLAKIAGTYPRLSQTELTATHNLARRSCAQVPQGAD